MAMPAWVPEAWAKLSQTGQKQAGDYLKFLLMQEQEENKPEKEFPFGLLKGKIMVAENFDDPLEAFEEYL